MGGRVTANGGAAAADDADAEAAAEATAFVAAGGRGLATGCLPFPVGRFGLTVSSEGSTEQGVSGRLSPFGPDALARGR